MRKLATFLLVLVIGCVVYVWRTPRETHAMLPTVTDAEVQSALDEIKRTNHLDDRGLEHVLAAQGYTLERYKDDLRNQLRALRSKTPGTP